MESPRLVSQACLVINKNTLNCMNPTTIPLHTGTSSYPPHHLSSLLQFHDDANDYRFHLSCDFSSVWLFVCCSSCCWDLAPTGGWYSYCYSGSCYYYCIFLVIVFVTVVLVVFFVIAVVVVVVWILTAACGHCCYFFSLLYHMGKESGYREYCLQILKKTLLQLNQNWGKMW